MSLRENPKRCPYFNIASRLAGNHSGSKTTVVTIGEKKSGLDSKFMVHRDYSQTDLVLHTDSRRKWESGS